MTGQTNVSAGRSDRVCMFPNILRTDPEELCSGAFASKYYVDLAWGTKQYVSKRDNAFDYPPCVETHQVFPPGSWKPPRRSGSPSLRTGSWTDTPPARKAFLWVAPTSGTHTCNQAGIAG